MLRLLFWLVVIGALALVLEWKLPIPGIAAEEIVYTTTPPVSSCSQAGCMVVYTLELANTGRSPQEVRVRLRSEPLPALLVAPTVRRASEAEVATTTNDRPGIEAVSVGALAPDERVALVFAARVASRESMPGWDRVLVGIDPTAGAARPGDVGAMSPARVVHAAARVVHRIVVMVQQATSS